MKRLVHELAERELREALEYYTAISPELGVRFYREMEQLMTEVCARPTLYREFDPPARRHFTDRFPYGVIYVVHNDAVWIVAIMHLHRQPGYWRSRVEP